MTSFSTAAAYILTVLIGYLLGCSNMALYLSRLKGVDMRQTGSKNLGTCNAYLSLGFPCAVIVFIHDAGKAVLAILICRLLFPDTALIGAVAGAAAVLGHIYPFYLHFHGGKGFAAFIGMSLMLDWRFALLILALMLLLTLLTNYIAVGTAVTVLFFPIALGISTHSIPAALILLADTAVILYKHRENFKHIADGSEIGFRSRPAA